MTTAAVKLEDTPSFDVSNFTKSLPNVWLSDAFCFTPWYSAALVLALKRAGLPVRFIATEVSREPEYFANFNIHPQRGPFRFDEIGGLHPAMKRAFRLAAHIANTAALSYSLNHRQEERPDIIHLQQVPSLNYGFSTDFRLIASARRSGIPVVHTVHNLLPHDSGDRLRKVYRRLYSEVDHLICHSVDVADALTEQFQIPTRSISVIPHGPLFEEIRDLNPNQWREARTALNISPSRPVVLWQGVLAPYKGVDILLKAWSLCMLRWKQKDTRPLLLIAGTGSSEERASLLAKAECQNSIRTDLHYILTADLPAYYRAADLLVYPYRSITTSGALLTGLSYNKPIIGSDLAPFREYLKHGENALLVGPGNVVELAAALESTLEGIAAIRASASPSNDGSLYKDLSLGALTNRERYVSWDSIAQQTIALYRELLHK